MLKIFEKIVGEKKKYRQMKARVEALPEDYQYVYKKIQQYMWGFAAGDGYDMIKVQYDLIELFEAGAADGRKVLELTGEDVAAFSDALLRNAKNYIDKRRESLNQDILKKLGNQKQV